MSKKYKIREVSTEYPYEVVEVVSESIQVIGHFRTKDEAQFYVDIRNGELEGEKELDF